MQQIRTKLISHVCLYVCCCCCCCCWLEACKLSRILHLRKHSTSCSIKKVNSRLQRSAIRVPLFNGDFCKLLRKMPLCNLKDEPAPFAFAAHFLWLWARPKCNCHSFCSCDTTILQAISPPFNRVPWIFAIVVICETRDLNSLLNLKLNFATFKWLLFLQNVFSNCNCVRLKVDSFISSSSKQMHNNKNKWPVEKLRFNLQIMCKRMTFFLLSHLFAMALFKKLAFKLEQSPNFAKF